MNLYLYVYYLSDSICHSEFVSSMFMLSHESGISDFIVFWIKPWVYLFVSSVSKKGDMKKSTQSKSIHRGLKFGPVQ